MSTFCSYCGSMLRDWKRPHSQCSGCGRVHWRNPIAVVIALVSVIDPLTGKVGVLSIRRGIEPAIGQLALPGGFIDAGESPAQAAAREVLEETGVQVSSDAFRLLDFNGWGLENSVIKSPSSDNLLIFLASQGHQKLPSEFTFDHEVQEVKILTEPEPLCWSTHTTALQVFFQHLKYQPPF